MASGAQAEYYWFTGGQFKDGVEHRARKLGGVPYGFMNGRREGVRGGSSGSEGVIRSFLTGDTGSYYTGRIQ
jgi:hypothetical protein